MPPMYTNNQCGHRDHLGNIREVLDANGAVCQYTDYYAFGAPFCMPGTYMGATLQQYEYNGKELDLMHGLNTYDYGARQYYPVVPVWDRMDPLCEKYYGVSPYAYCANNPMRYIDADGNAIKIWYKDKNGNNTYYRFSGFHGQKSIKIPNNQFVKDVISAYVYDTKNGGGKAFLKAVHGKHYIYIDDARLETGGTNMFSVNGHQPTVYWNPEFGIITSTGGRQSPATILDHELDHAVDDVMNPNLHNQRENRIDSKFENLEERRVILGSETITAIRNGEAPRNDHKGIPFRVSNPTSIKPYKNK